MPPSLFRVAPTRVALTLVALLAIAPAIRAQSLLPSTVGLSMQGHATGGTMTTAIYPGAGGRAAVGVGGEVAYGATPRLSLVGRLARIGSVSATTTESTDYVVVQGDLGLRWMAMPGARVRPFAEAGLALRRLAFAYAAGTGTGTGVRRDFSAFNGGPTASAGAMLFRTDRLSIEGAGTYTSVTFSTWKVDGKPESLAPVTSDMLGVRVGVRYWFSK
jgi:hypothetical protein